MRNYVIAVGGTGVRCLEAVIYLAAAGWFNEPLYVFIIDPDISNGNGKTTKELIEQYHHLYCCSQPSDPKTSWKSWTKVQRPVLFQAEINKPLPADNQKKPKEQSPFPYVWEPPASTTFENHIGYDTITDINFKNFVKLFYTDEDLKINTAHGYLGRPHAGSVGLSVSLSNTANLDTAGLKSLLTNLHQDITNGDTRVFIMGSVFGGSGAAAIPTLPSFFKTCDQLRQNSNNLRFGCAMLGPYFQFPNPEVTQTKTGIPQNAAQSDKHMVSTQAALYYYAQQTPPDYQHVYFIGSPERHKTSATNVPSGGEQKNKAHYAELIAALAAADFFKRNVQATDRVLHYDMENNMVSWDTLPVSHEAVQEIRKRLVAFTTFSYLYKNFLNDALEKQYISDAVWYKGNFKSVPFTKADEPSYRKLNQFSASFLKWLKEIGESGNTRMAKMFNWEKLLFDRNGNIQHCGEAVGALAVETKTKYPAKDGYDKILKKMDIKLQDSGTDPTGLLIYLLHHAVTEFCKENYNLEQTPRR